MSNRNMRSERDKGWATTHTGREIYQDIRFRAKAMRESPTRAEEILWQRLRRKQVGGYRFRRQHPISQFIVDFYCAKARLVIEVDGGAHDEPGHDDYDSQRDAFLEGLGLRVLRFKNKDVIHETHAVIEAIALALTG